MNQRIKILSVGSCLPQRIVSNFDLEKIVNTTNEWIVQRTGIHVRHIASQEEATSDLAVQAIVNAINKTQISLQEIDMIICATTTPDYTFPSTACIIQKKLGIKKPIIAFDIQAVCSGFVYALSIAHDMINGGKIKTAIVVGADKMSSIVDWNDRSTCVLFGDGAGAVILQQTNAGDASGIIDYDICADGNFSDILFTTGGVSQRPRDLQMKNFYGDIVNNTAGVVKMNGQGVFKHAVEKMVSSVQAILQKNNYNIHDVKKIIPHQANYRILSLVAEKMKISPDKFILTIGEHANTSSASIPLAMDVAIKDSRIKRGDLVVLEALGGGLTWGSVLLRL